MIPIFKAENQNGLTFRNKCQLMEYLRRMPDLVDVVIRKPRDLRSHRQNRYYFGVVIPIIAEALGYEKEDMHEILKSIFLSEDFEFNGEKVKIIKSTSSLNTEEFERYLAQVRTWASCDESKPRICVPLPNEVEF